MLVELFHWSEEHFFNQVQFHKVKSWTKKMFTDHIYFVNKVWETAGEHTPPVIVTLKLYLDLLSGLLWSIPELYSLLEWITAIFDLWTWCPLYRSYRAGSRTAFDCISLCHIPLCNPEISILYIPCRNWEVLPNAYHS